MQSFREFDAGPDPFGRTWHVLFKWLQTAISLRHSNSVDVKYLLTSGEDSMEKTVSMLLPDLVDLAERASTKVNDPWCSRLAMQHLRYLVESGEDMEKSLVTPSKDQLSAYQGALGEWETGRIRKIRSA
jgi:hypothetical protein